MKRKPKHSKYERQTPWIEEYGCLVILIIVALWIIGAMILESYGVKLPGG